jgi:hypothetical protein
VDAAFAEGPPRVEADYGAAPPRVIADRHVAPARIERSDDFAAPTIAGKFLPPPPEEESCIHRLREKVHHHFHDLP